MDNDNSFETPPRDDSWVEKMAWERELADLKNKLDARQYEDEDDKRLMIERVGGVRKQVRYKK